VTLSWQRCKLGGGNCEEGMFGAETVWGIVPGEIYRGMCVGKHAGRCLQYYMSLRAAVIIGDMVNTHTDTHTDSFCPAVLLALLAELTMFIARRV